MNNRKFIKLISLISFSLMVLGIIVLNNSFYSKPVLKPDIMETETDQIDITELSLDFHVRGKISDNELLVTGNSSKTINIYNLQSKKQSVLAEPYYSNNFIKSVASNNNWLIWVEDEAEIVNAENKPFKWSIIAQNIATSERFIIDSSSSKDNRFKIPLPFINYTPEKISISDDNQIVYSKIDVENQVVISKLVLFDVNTKTQKIVSQNGPVTDELIYLPTIQGQYIAWSKFEELNTNSSEYFTQFKFSDLYLYDIKTQEIRQLTNSEFYYAPSIYENKLVASYVPKNKPYYSEIILMDLNSGQIKSIVNSSSSNYKNSKFAEQIYRDRPKINQNYVMWLNSGFSNRFIYNYLDQKFIELYEDIEDNAKNNISVYSMFDNLIFMKFDSVDEISKHMCIKLS